jgi:hypothetical protein
MTYFVERGKISYYLEMKIKNYYNVGTVPKSN